MKKNKQCSDKSKSWQYGIFPKSPQKLSNIYTIPKKKKLKKEIRFSLEFLI